MRTYKVKYAVEYECVVMIPEETEEDDKSKDKSLATKKAPSAKLKHSAHKPVAKKRSVAKNPASKASMNKASKKG